MPTMCDIAPPLGLDQPARGLFVDRLRPFRLRDNRLHRGAGVVENLFRRDAGLHARHHRLVIVERELRSSRCHGA